MATAAKAQVPAGRSVGAATHFVGGTAGGVAGILLAYPLDTLKVRMQTAGAGVGLGGCAAAMFRDEGVRGFYKGLLSPIAGVAFIKAVAFGSNGFFQECLQRRGNPGRKLNLWELALASFSSGVVTSFVVAPFERVKCTVQANPGKYSGVLEATKSIVAREGVSKGLFRGTAVTILREGPSYGFYFMTYDAVKQWMNCHYNGPPPAYALALSGGLAGVMCWVPIYPIDVVKTRIQADNAYNGFVDCARKSYQKEGAGVFFRGLSATVLRSFPMHATVFCTYELTIKLLTDVSL
eukprot:TRINITY_DN5041_c0_g2_i2.p2 TRINITY_DN5041_c0_g2~~TRINITY_DN5041_c0_g2_i2.p2  ORF type:complete len:306 (+),score=20.73 TRINITY_DN5041_c0_g2_i2:41-919(+)